MSNADAIDQSPSKRAAALYKQAQVLAEASIAHFVATLENAIEQANEIAEGGDLYPTGVRDICRKLGETATYRVQSINSIVRHDVRGVAELHAASLDEHDLALEMAQAAPPVLQAVAPAPQPVAAAKTAPAVLAPFPGRMIAEQLAAFGRRDQALPGEFARPQA